PCGPRLLPPPRRAIRWLAAAPSVTKLAEHRQALLGVALSGGGVASNHCQLGAGAQGRRDSPPVAECPEACQRLAEHGLANGWVTEIGCDEGVEPFQRGPDAEIVDAAERRRGGVPAALSGEDRETGPPGRGRGPRGGGSVAGGKSLIQRAPCFSEPAAQEPVPGQGGDQPGSRVVVVLEGGIQRG